MDGAGTGRVVYRNRDWACVGRAKPQRVTASAALRRLLPLGRIATFCQLPSASVRLHWSTRSPLPLTKVARVPWGTYRAQRTMFFDDFETWSLVLEEGRGNELRIGQREYTSEEDARGRAHDHARAMEEWLRRAG